MRITRSSKRGLLLLSVLFFTVLIAMFVSAAVAFAPSGFARTETDRSLQLADAAARSGIEWARMRISSDPHWCASVVKPPYVANGLYVTEGNGQVAGWVKQGADWTRFRLRFNYQDGAARPDEASDGMSNPGSANIWTDFPYVSCNNLRGSALRPIPLAVSSSGDSRSTGNWSTRQLTLAKNTLLLSCEGGSSNHVALDASGNPTGFSGGFRKRIIQTVLRFGSSQPITDAALMSAGDVQVIASGGDPTELLSSPANETSRVRSKGDLQALPGVHSMRGDLRFTGSLSDEAVLTGDVTTSTEIEADGFYQIPESKLKPLTSPVSLPAGVYVVNALGQVKRYNQDYADYVSSPGTGSDYTFPSGIEVVERGASETGPQWRVKVNQDVKVEAHDGVSDFALVPDGGAPQSRSQAGVPKMKTFSVQNAEDQVAVRSLVPGDSQRVSFASNDVKKAYMTALDSLSSGAKISSDGDKISYQMARPDGNGMFNVEVSSDGLQVPGNDEDRLALQNFLINDGDSASILMAAVNPSASFVSKTNANPEDSALTSAAKLHPDDLQLNLNGNGVDGLTFKGPGNLVFGSQVLGRGGALVSDLDVRFIGTSTDLSSSPEAGLGLNCYAKRDFIVDSYQVKGPGDTGFGKVDLTGVVYAWRNINISAGTGVGAQNFKFKGAMVAYGGDPAGAPKQMEARTEIRANNIEITYDPSYVSALMSSGPYVLKTVSWHEF